MRLVVILVIGLLLGPESFAQAPDAQAEQFGNDLQSYFRHPDPGAIVDEFFSLPPSEITESGRLLVVGAFFSRLINNDAAIGDLLVKKASGASDAFKTGAIVAALNFSQHPHRIDLIRKIGGDEALKGLVPSHFDLRNSAITSPVDLDMMWACFFATGDDTYVDRVVQMTADYVSEDQLRALAASAGDNPQAKERVMKAVIARGAVWSLTSNAMNYPEVRGALVNFMQHHQGMPAAMAAVILAKTSPN